ncbi:MAG TPA: hypothetical protein DCS07_15820 [Bdellovibrionales bacterium]|nr:MAG: hypothetical protein A2Z97_12135 [Bdellovibrionales bacterium GWB1_52_6]OFZ03692.1 MAG: hypothetical protein A2X97_14120 [Bdellovibrionales bacterium GWA1_52_35]HAR44075.1 hypothetical protein [Bdellovibrionales bacterium]HCM38797.1 hypothetical protein [Bdellovibrionales bacterium]
MKSSVKLISLATGFALLAGCSTIRPYKSGRVGFLDRDRQYASRSAREVKEEPTLTARAIDEPELTKADFKGLQFKWPLNSVSVTSPYGKRGSDFHEGIDLRAPTGTPIHAVEAGTVLYADKRVSGYGKMVVLRHSNGFATIYAHSSKLLVRRGQKVKKGQKIALAGSTGRSSGPHLHFEVRKGVTPLDPSRVIQLGTAYAAADKATQPRMKKTVATRTRTKKRVSKREKPTNRKLASVRSHSSTRLR